MPKICLAMIVKDESGCIVRCLDALIPWIDTWCIVDTGSTDGTPDIVIPHLATAGRNGNLYRRPWVDFATNRTQCLDLARADQGKPDYLLVMDADDTFVVPDGFQWPELTESAYELELRGGDVSWWRAQLFRASDPWRYESEIHEYAIGGGPIAPLRGPWIKIGSDGGRKSAGESSVYAADAEVLKGMIEKRPKDPRAWFYLAESYRFSGQPEAAINAYGHRLELEGWDEERWWSQYQIGVLWEQILEGWNDASFDLSTEAYDAAYRIRPTRAEPLVKCASLLRRKGRHAEAFMRACTAIQIPRPPDRWLVEESCYVWRAIDEYALASHNLGFHAQAAEVTMRLLANPKLPHEQHKRLTENLGFYRKGLAHGG